MVALSCIKSLDTASEAYVTTFMNDTLGEDGEKSLRHMKKKPLMVDSYPKVKVKKQNRSLGLSAQQKKLLGLYMIPKEKQKYVS